MAALKQLASCVKEVLERQSGQSQLAALDQAILDMEEQRRKAQQRIRDIRQRERDCALSQCDAVDRPVWQTADAAFGATTIIIAQGRYIDKLLLLAKHISRSEWLKARAPKAWMARHAMYL